MPWQEGYVTDVAYTSGAYPVTAPAFLSACALVGGVRAPDPSQPFRFLELGCGTGMNLCTLAAANPHAEFVGVDFNPAHAALGEHLIRDAGLTNIRILEASFADVAAPAEALGRFQYVVGHGIWTWVAATVQDDIVRVLDRCVAPGGLVYMGYNNMAGWASSLPLQRLIRHHAARAPGDSIAKMRVAVEAVLKLAAVTPGLEVGKLRSQLGDIEDLSKIAPSTLAYLVHEYLNDHWAPVFPDQIARRMAEAKLTYVASANPFSTMQEVIFSPEQRQAIAAYPDEAGRRQLADLLFPVNFRQDIFVRGAVPLIPARKAQAMHAVLLAGSGRLDKEALTVDLPTVQLQLEPDIYLPVFARLQAGPATLGELLALTAQAPRAPSAGELLSVLIGSQTAAPCARPPAARDDEAERAAARRYNMAMVKALRETVAASFALASPLIGAGYSASLQQCLGYLLHTAGAEAYPELDLPPLRATIAENAHRWRALAML